jgi:hypothetical protein
MAQDLLNQSSLQVVLYPVLVAVIVDSASQRVREATVLDTCLGEPCGPVAAIATAEGAAWWPRWRVAGELETELDTTAREHLEASLAAATKRIRFALGGTAIP